MSDQKLATPSRPGKISQMEPIIFIACCICGDETPAWLNEAGKPDIPPSWRGMAPACCPDAEQYVCSPRCAMRCGAHLLQTHKANDVNVRQIEACMGDDEIMEMLSDCAEPGTPFNGWEQEFLDSCQHQMSDGRKLTSNQIEKLQELWERI